MNMKQTKLFKKTDQVPANFHLLRRHDTKVDPFPPAKFINIPKYNTDQYYSKTTYRPISKLF